MPYLNDSQRYLEIVGLALGIMENDRWVLLDNKDNYSLLFAAYIKMIEKDEDNFFVDSTKKEAIINSLKRTTDFYRYTQPEELIHSIQNLTSNNAADFLLLPLMYPCTNDDVGEDTDSIFLSVHASGALIYKEDDGYKFVMIDKASIFTRNIDATAAYVTIPPENLSTVCRQLLIDRDDILYYVNDDGVFYKKPYEILHFIVKNSVSGKPIKLPIKMNFQPKGNCVVGNIEATLKTALYNCQKNIFALNNKNSVPITWKNTLEMRKQFVTAMVEMKPEIAKCFWYLFNLYSSKKKMNIKKKGLPIDVINTAPIKQIMLGELPEDAYEQAKKKFEETKKRAKKRSSKKNAALSKKDIVVFQNRYL
ncbi:hypothetical protein [Enterococcus ratti]|uniref:Uncharacterized protein n=1 Tax=Enterococcus ratti TaxID=150033 RepID=A0A1L8WSG1_9ENTE|nr:hypothetical protein [Enterococcus ratti]OJG83943.1 hypothetical protein RV14_GL000120 [Enterococcus ratti]